MGQLIGLARVGRDAELRHTQQGDAVASVSLAFNYGKKGQDGNRPTQWVDASIWGARAESLTPYLLKGTLLQVTLDDPHIETFQRQDGTQGHKMVGRISSLEFASRPPESTGQAAPQTTQARLKAPQPPQRTPQNEYQAARNGQLPPSPGGGGGFADMEDNIPFARHHGSRNWACFQ